MPSSNTFQDKTYHFIGIGGIGMSGLARILLRRGAKVTGSDISTNYVTESLLKQGAQIHLGHSEKNIQHTATVVVSTDIPANNPELVAAYQMKCPVLHRSDLLLALTQGKKILAVAGTHGKTTTTSLLIHVLTACGLDPAFAVGGVMHGLQSNASDGKGEYFVLEADESDGTFLKYPYAFAIVTNIDTDHLAHFKTMEHLKDAFQTFLKKSPNSKQLIYCIDDPILASMNVEGISYGFSEHADFRIQHFRQEGFQIVFDIHADGKTFKDITIPLTGKHNALNATAVFAKCYQLGVSVDSIKKALQTFSGVKRRMDKKADLNTVQIFDDYAHHPTEIDVTLKAIKTASYEKRVIAVFQPHRYSRMKYCMDTIGSAFSSADEIIVTDLYTANEEAVDRVSTETILANIVQGSSVPVHYFPRKNLAASLHTFLRPHDVMITLGAGDITKVGDELRDLLQKTPPKKYTVGIFYGGMSCEHEISCISAKSIIQNLHPDYYVPKYFYITKTGKFRIGSQDCPVLGDDEGEILPVHIFQELSSCDLFIPVLHGPYGEDGLVQGFLDTLSKPYVGCDVRSCAASMDKAFAKAICLHHGIKTADFVSFDLASWKEQADEYIQAIMGKLTFPIFVKPPHLGSSIGVTKVSTLEELRPAIDRVFLYDTHCLVEQGIKGREIEFAVLGNFRVRSTNPGEILTHGKVYSYEAKYGKDGFSTDYQADLPKEVIENGKAIATKVFQLLSCQGLSRIDFFLDETNTFYFNESNPFPGFTSISLYPKMWESSGMKMPALLDELLILALDRVRTQKKIFMHSSLHLPRV